MRRAPSEPQSDRTPAIASAGATIKRFTQSWPSPCAAQLAVSRAYVDGKKMPPSEQQATSTAIGNDTHTSNWDRTVGTGGTSYSGTIPALRRSAATVAAMSSAKAPGSVRRVVVRIAHIALSSGRLHSTVSPTNLSSSVVYSAKVSGALQYS